MTSGPLTSLVLNDLIRPRCATSKIWTHWSSIFPRSSCSHRARDEARAREGYLLLFLIKYFCCMIYLYSFHPAGHPDLEVISWLLHQSIPGSTSAPRAKAFPLRPSTLDGSGGLVYADICLAYTHLPLVVVWVPGFLTAGNS